MLLYGLLVASCCLHYVQATMDSPRIIIVGAGASGVAAATRLMENGFNNVTILEAENRIGGRVFTIQFGGYMVDLGGQWVHGEEGSVSFEMASALGLIDHSAPSNSSIHSSSDCALTEETADELMDVYDNFLENQFPEEFKNGTAGAYFQSKLDEYFDAHPNLAAERASIIDMFDVLCMGLHAADSWHNLSSRTSYIVAAGDQEMNWKDKGYSMIFDIMMKKYPNPAEELPLMNNTILNAVVRQINYDLPGGGVRVITSNGDEYIGDHVIVTTSIAVLQADHRTMFNPQLSEKRTNVIKRLKLGNVAKVFLLYDEPWWHGEDSMHLHWTSEDRKKLENDPEKSWLLGLVDCGGLAYRPRLLLCWVAGKRAREMEDLSDDLIFSHVKEALPKFFGRTHNLTEPTAMFRSKWYSNEHFRGTWSYQSPEYIDSDSKVTDLSDPIMKDGKPVVQFAGEATHPTQFSTVHGAIATGWREADRLKALYPNVKS